MVLSKLRRRRKSSKPKQPKNQYKKSKKVKSKQPKKVRTKKRKSRRKSTSKKSHKKPRTKTISKPKPKILKGGLPKPKPQNGPPHYYRDSSTVVLHKEFKGDESLEVGVLEDGGIEKNKAEIRFIHFFHVKQIAPKAFNSFTKLEYVLIPGVTSIGDLAFAECPNLKVVYAPNLQINPSIYGKFGERIIIEVSKVLKGLLRTSYIEVVTLFLSRQKNYYDSISYEDTKDKIKQTFISGLDIPLQEKFIYVNYRYYTKIGKNAFDKCTNLEFVILAEVTTIEEGVFVNCKNLKFVYIPKMTLDYGLALKVFGPRNELIIICNEGIKFIYTTENRLTSRLFYDS